MGYIVDMSRTPRAAAVAAASSAPDLAVGLALAGPLPRSITDTVGRTPLVELRRMNAGLGARVAVKLESRNPTSSVKDRVAAALLEEADARGLVHPRTTIVAATSGNTGLALAQLAAARGLRVRLAVPEDWAHERLALLLYLGADVVMTRGGGMRAATDRAREIAESTPDALLLDQFRSAANPEVHRRTTAQEIWRDSRGEVAAFVAGVGTGGTISGVAEGLREHRPGVFVVAVEPASSPVLSGGAAGAHGIQGIGPGFVPPLFCRDRVDRVAAVTDAEAFECTRRLAREEGILAGVSSGATVHAALSLAAEPRMEGKLVVAMAGDSAERYVSSPKLEPSPAPLRRGRR
jgi:cysteine synthase A